MLAPPPGEAGRVLDWLLYADHAAGRAAERLSGITRRLLTASPAMSIRKAFVSG